METVKKGDCIEIEFTGYSNGEVFDSNVSDDLKEISDRTPRKTLVFVGEKMIVSGLDNDFEGKSLGKKYEINLTPKDAFGERKRELVRMLPLKVFANQRQAPRPGLSFFFDNVMGKVIAVSGSRVTTDFNNPMAGKEVKYIYTIKRIVSDKREQAEAFFEYFLRFKPKIEVSGDSAIVHAKKEVEPIIMSFKDNFSKIVKLELKFKHDEEIANSSKAEQKAEQQSL